MNIRISIAVLLQKAKETFMVSSKRMTTSTLGYNAAVKSERITKTDTIMSKSSKHKGEQIQVTENVRQCNINFIKPRSKYNTVFA